MTRTLKIWTKNPISGKINSMNLEAETPNPILQQRLRGINPLRLKRKQQKSQGFGEKLIGGLGVACYTVMIRYFRYLC